MNRSNPQCYTPEQLAKVKKESIPKHIAIIPDGNRRWEKKNGIPGEGHKVGCERVTSLISAAKELGIEVVTLYTFSTENWKRSKEEIDIVMNLVHSYLKEQTPRMIRDGIRFHTIGDLTKVRDDLKEQISATKNATCRCSSIDLVLAINYGSRDEIRRAIHKILKAYESNQISPEDISESLISQYLDTSKWKDPDLFIRTSGEQRISNFLLWQISYAEIYTTSVLWPDFSSDHLLEAVISYQNRNARLGA